MEAPNPNGANQYQLDPRQLICWEYYVDPKSETFGNATQSAIKAGYEPDYADQITTVEWFKGKVRRLNMLSKAERNLDKVLDFEMADKDGKVNTPVASLVVDVSKTVVKTLGKDEGYSDRTEHTGKGGGAIAIEGVEITVRK